MCCSFILYLNVMRPDITPDETVPITTDSSSSSTVFVVDRISNGIVTLASVEKFITCDIPVCLLPKGSKVTPGCTVRVTLSVDDQSDSKKDEKISDLFSLFERELFGVAIEPPNS